MNYDYYRAQDDSCERLSKIAAERRAALLQENIYVDADGRRYTPDHPNASQRAGGIDDPTNSKGKGTGLEMDYLNGGSSVDINARNQAFLRNRYTPNRPYQCFIE